MSTICSVYRSITFIYTKMEQNFASKIRNFVCSWYWWSSVNGCWHIWKLAQGRHQTRTGPSTTRGKIQAWWEFPLSLVKTHLNLSFKSGWNLFFYPRKILPHGADRYWDVPGLPKKNIRTKRFCLCLACKKSQHKPNKMNASLLDNSGGKVHQIKVGSLKSFQVLHSKD